jgi:FkbM family methyltransferase
MKFRNEFGFFFNHRNFEVKEQLQANTYIEPNCIVLELGARYGTVSCIINKKLSHPLNQVVVEPDQRVWQVLEENMILNNCNFHIVKGFVSNTPMNLINHTNDLYATTSIKSISSSIKSYTLNEIETMYNLKFNTLVADCEGFLEQFFDENPNFYEQLNLVMFEKDFPNKCDYNKIKAKLLLYGFECIETGFQEVWKRVQIKK